MVVAVVWYRQKKNIVLNAVTRALGNINTLKNGDEGKINMKFNLFA